MSEPYKKKFSGNSSADGASKSKAPVTSQDNKRAFDARPKPSGDRRRDDHDKPSQHYDRASTKGLDPDPGIEADVETAE